MIDKIAEIIGYALMSSMAILLIAGLLWFAYQAYDYWLKKILGWKERQTRKDIFYFIKHKEEIQDYIKNKKGEPK